MSAGDLAPFMDALVGLEETISDDLTVERWRPYNPNTPLLYNWLLPSPAAIPATMTEQDTLNFAIRVVLRRTDADETGAAVEQYYDLVRDVIDSDLIQPSQSQLRSVCHFAKRTSSRTVIDTFNEIDYLAVEFTLQAELRRQFQLT